MNSKIFCALAFLGAILSARGVELADATLVVPPALTRQEQSAVRMLVEEVEKRARIRWPVVVSWPTTTNPVIVVAPRQAIPDFAGPYSKDFQARADINAAEGYRLSVRNVAENPAVLVVGNDDRGVLFGVGRLLRELRMRKDKAALDDHLEIVSAPKYPLRGHQLGYRPKCNSYDAWDLPTWEQYYRDLIVFGCNSIELIPPRSDDAADSPHFPRSPMEMMVGMSKLADDYGLDVWVWYPAMDPDYSETGTVESAVKEWSDVFRKLPRLDAVFVPGGDPGHTRPKYLMALLEKQTESLHRYHPKAQMWVSPQSFNQVWLEEFFEILRRDHPAWLTGIVFGPQQRISLPQLRERVPSQYPIRHYPDITHSRQCQYPVPDWDTAYAVTEARECINPRPEDEATIFRAVQPFSNGFLTYSEGCNDDVNKIVWSALGWDPEAKAADILREYGRYFISDETADDFAQGLLALERNWRGPLISNAGVETTLAQFQSLEKKATPANLKNWRFQQALFRAYYDAYTRRRLIYETELEARAMERLREAPDRGSLAAMTEAESILRSASVKRVREDLRIRIFELGEALFQSIGMQLSVKKYQAIAVDRGAMLDTLGFPLNNRLWLEGRFAAIRQITPESARLKAVEEIVEWANPGPGGFYDDLGNISRQPHLVRGPGLAGDPGFLSSPRVGFEEDTVVDEPDERPEGARRMSWIDHEESLYDAPLRMHYDGLDSMARYKIRVVYAGDSRRKKIRLIANDGIEVHPLMVKPFPFRPVEFTIPSVATANGTLTLSWFGEAGLGGNGRGCQVSEVWLIKENSSGSTSNLK